MATPAQLQQLYLSYFGRPADPGGVLFYAFASVDSVLATFSASAESQALYGSTFGTDQINAIYRNLFNRDAESAGSAYWTQLVQSGAITAAQAALTMLQSAGNDDQTAITNKLQVAAAFTAALDTSAKEAGYAGNLAALLARQFLAKVDATPASVTSATGSIDVQVGLVTGLSTTAQSFTLTVQNDIFAGAAGNDTFSGVAGTGATYSLGDVLSGGAGTDTLSISTDGNFTVADNVTGVERLVVTNSAAGSIATLAAGSSVTELVNSGSSAQLSFAVARPHATTLTVQGTTAATTLLGDTAGLTATDDSVYLTLNNVHEAAVTPSISSSLGAAPVVSLQGSPAASNSYEGVTVNSIGSVANRIVLSTDAAQTSLATLVVTGSTALSLALGNDNIQYSLSTIDASGTSGGVSIGSDLSGTPLSGRDHDHNVVLGSGNDAVYFGASLSLSGGDTVNGGAGTDTLGVSAAVTNAQLAHVSNMEVLRFDVSGGSIVQDAGIAALAGYGYAVAAPTGSTNALTLNNLAVGTTTSVLGYVNTLNEVLKTPGGVSDTLTVALNYNSFTATGGSTLLVTLADVAGLETLNLVSSNPGHVSTLSYITNSIVSDQVTAAQVLTGDTNFFISNAIVSPSFDASAFTGQLTITGRATAGTTIKGGSNNDNITLGTGADTVDAGAGNDRVILGATGTNNTSGADVITLGGGNDSLFFTGNNSAGTGSATDYSAFARVTDFSVPPSLSADFIGFSANDADFSLTSAGGTTTMTGLAKGAVAKGLAATPSLGDTMVLQGIAQNAAPAALTANVSFFKLSTGVDFTTDVKTLFAAAIGSGSVTGLAANGNYVVSAYDTIHNQMVVGVVNVGSNSDGDTTLAASDFTNTGVAVVGVIDMTSTAYGQFSAANLQLALG
ncbi:MAG: DUF4214 domain-containing protein [Pseudomonadota bacterium]